MRVIFRLGFREIRQRPGRSVLTLLSIAMGVAAVVAVTITATTTDRAFAAMYRSVTGRAALEVSAVGAGSVDESVLDLVTATAGVKSAAPLIRRQGVLYFHDQRVKLLSLGIDPARDKAVHDFVVTAGKSLEQAKGVLLETSLARSIGAQPGDTVKLLTRRGLVSVPVAGLYRTEGTVATEGGAGLLMDIAAAQLLSKMPGKVHAIQVVLNANADEQAVRDEIARQLPSGLQVQRPAARSSFADETALAIQRGMQTSRAFLLLVATLIISNTYLINFTQRRRQFGILRAVGASQRQVALILCWEATLMGLLGSLLGWIAGIIGAHYLTRAMGNLYDTSLPPIDISPLSLAVAVVFGVLISLLGVWVSARRVSRLQPLEALREVATAEITEGSQRPAWLGLVLVVICGGVLGACIQDWLPMQIAAWAGVLILMGLVLLMQPIVPPLCRLAEYAMRAVLPLESRLARLQLLRHRTRTALTIGVLFVALGSGIGLASSVIDNVNDVKGWYRRSMVADFFVRAMSPDMASGQAADMPDAVDAEIRQIPHLTSVETARFIRAEAADRSVIVVAHDYGANSQLMFDLTAGSERGLRERLRRGEVVVGSVLAERVGGLRPGDQISLKTDTGKQSLRIAAVANDYLAGGQTIYMVRTTAEKLLGVSGVDAYLIHADHMRLAEVRAALEQVADKYGLLLQTFTEMQQQIDQMMAGVVAGLWALVVIGFVVAAFGVANTLTMNVLEQTRELGLLRIVGTTQWQVRNIVLVQALMMGVLAIVPGAAAGIVIAYLINLTSYTVSGHAVSFGVHPELVVGSLVIGLAVAIVAAWFPARRAARLSMLDALQR